MKKAQLIQQIYQLRIERLADELFAKMSELEARHKRCEADDPNRAKIAGEYVGVNHAHELVCKLLREPTLTNEQPGK